MLATCWIIRHSHMNSIYSSPQQPACSSRVVDWADPQWEPWRGCWGNEAETLKHPPLGLDERPPGCLEPPTHTQSLTQPQSKPSPSGPLQYRYSHRQEWPFYCTSITFVYFVYVFFGPSRSHPTDQNPPTMLTTSAVQYHPHRCQLRCDSRP